MTDTTFVMYHSTYYPEDGYHDGILKIFDDKISAFEELIAEENSSNSNKHYEDLFIKEFKNDTIYVIKEKISKYQVKNNLIEQDDKEKIPEYREKNNFIIDEDKNIYYRKNNDIELIIKNKGYFTKFNQVEKMANELNEMFQQDYNNKMVKYRNGEISHPILRKYNLDRVSYLSNYPFEEDNLKIKENKLTIALEEILEFQKSLKN